MTDDGFFYGCEAYDPTAEGVDPLAMENSDTFSNYLFGDGQFDADDGQ